MATELAAILASPDRYLHSFEGDAAVLVSMDRAAYRRSIFLDHRILPAGNEVLRVAASDLAGAVPSGQPLDWIFHVAHCGSTLFARAYEALVPRLVLREPLALRQLAMSDDPAALLEPALALLSRRYPGDGPTLIKANVPVNFLLDRITAICPQDRAVLLYCQLDDYLCAILRSDQHRNWVRGVTAALAQPLGGNLPDSDAELAALLWAAQLGRFDATLDAMVNARSLDAEDFFAEPVATLAATCALLDQPVDPAAVNELTAGPLFATYSKNPAQAFDNTARVDRQAQLRSRLEPEIDRANAWIGRNFGNCDALLAKLAGRRLV